MRELISYFQPAQVAPAPSMLKLAGASMLNGGHILMLYGSALGIAAVTHAALESLAAAMPTQLKGLKIKPLTALSSTLMGYCITNGAFASMPGLKSARSQELLHITCLALGALMFTYVFLNRRPEEKREPPLKRRTKIS